MKFEYEDLYKFIVSLGMALVAIAIFIPWLFLKEQFDLFVPESKIALVSKTAQSIIIQRQEAVSLIIHILPWFSSLLIIIGLILITFGLIKWRKNQLYIDEQNELKSKISKESNRISTEDEKEEDTIHEYIAQPMDEKTYTNPNEIILFKEKYQQIESLVYDKFNQIYQNEFSISQNKKIGGIVFDIVMEGKNLFTKDYLIEVKYIRKGFSFGWLNEVFLKNMYARNVYSHVTNKLPNTLLLIIIATDAYKKDKYDEMLEQLRNESIGRKGKDLVRIIPEETLATISGDEFRNKINFI